MPPTAQAVADPARAARPPLARHQPHAHAAGWRACDVPHLRRHPGVPLLGRLLRRARRPQRPDHARRRAAAERGRRQLRLPRREGDLQRRPGAPPRQRVPVPDAVAGDDRDVQGEGRAARSSPTARTASTPSRNEYPQFDGQLRGACTTRSSSPNLHRRRASSRRRSTSAQKVTYHDSCYLGRHNGELRRAARRSSSRCPARSSSRCRATASTSFCCGAGGGHMCVEESQGQAHQRRALRRGAGDRRRHRRHATARSASRCSRTASRRWSRTRTKRARPMDLAELLELTVLGGPPKAAPSPVATAPAPDGGSTAVATEEPASPAE